MRGAAAGIAGGERGGGPFAHASQLALSRILGKGCSSQKWGIFLWKAVEKVSVLRERYGRRLVVSRKARRSLNLTGVAKGSGLWETCGHDTKKATGSA